MSFPRYPEYKDSGVKWLGEVPAHWDVERINTVATFNDEVLGESTPVDQEIEYIEISGVLAGQGIVETSTLTFGNAPSRARRVVRDGDVLISTVRTYLRAIAQVKNPPENMIASTGFAVLHPHRINSGFLGYACHSENFLSEVIARSVGVSYPAINASELARLPIPLPTAPEQAAIATFLDHETAKIDALVAEQERLIELLKEKRLAVISNAVTKGLDPSVPMKDSGVEWLGEVPAHWTVSSLRHSLTNIFNGLTADQIEPGPATVPVTRIETISDGTINFERVGFVSVENARPDRKLRSGDICFSNINSLKMIGNCAIFLGGAEIYGGMNLLVLRPLSTLNSHYLYWAIRSSGFRETVESLAKPAINQASISQSSLLSICVCTPPKEEQNAIATFIDHETAKVDALLDEAKSAIELLQERRTAIISAAVTGQIDVRQLA